MERMNKVAENENNNLSEEELKQKLDDILNQVEDETEEEEQAIEEEIEELSVEDELKEKLAQSEDQFLRAQAEIANMRNRYQKEREGLAKYRSQDLAKEILPALDNLDRALATEVTDENGENLKKGVEMVKNSLLAAFKATGIEEISALGEQFDPNLHQAVQTMPVEEGQEVNEVIQVLQNGYKLHDRVLRPTMVIVAQ